jgi:hypothetical protein
VKEVFQTELKLLCEKALLQLLATQELLAEEEMGSPLLGLMSLHDQQGVIESLMKMRFPLGQVTQPWVDLFVETLGHPQVVLPLFLLQVPN